MADRKLSVVLNAALAVILLALFGFLTNVVSTRVRIYSPLVWVLVWTLYGLVVLAMVGLRVLESRWGTRPAAPQHSVNRRQMLQRIQFDWIKGVLEPAVANKPRIDLWLREAPEVVEPHSVQSEGVVQRPHFPPTMLRIFDDHAGSLLILGKAGSGKTTLLLELARELIQRAESDREYPIPVVFKLSSWSRQQLPLADWMIEELVRESDVPREVAQTWIRNNKILPLLDDLDQVAQDRRQSCVEYINKFRKENGLLPIAICCTLEEYNRLIVKVRLSGAVAIDSLTRAQVDGYLKLVGAEHLADELGRHNELWTLLDTPLMLNVATGSYARSERSHIPRSGSLPARQHELWSSYLQAMLKRRSSKRYTSEETLHWLTWLSRSLKNTEQEVFKLEDLNLDYLPTKRSVGFARLAIGLLLGVFQGTAVGIAVGLAAGLRVGLLVGFVPVLDCCLKVLLAPRLTFSPCESLSWSWEKARELPFVFAVVPIVGLILALLVGAATSLNPVLLGSFVGLIGTLGGGKTAVLSGGLKFAVFRAGLGAGLGAMLGVALRQFDAAPWVIGGILAGTAGMLVDNRGSSERLRFAYKVSTFLNAALGAALLVALVQATGGGFTAGLRYSFLMSFLYVPGWAATMPFVRGYVSPRSFPNEGTRRSLRNAGLMFVPSLFVGGLAAAISLRFSWLLLGGRLLTAAILVPLLVNSVSMAVDNGLSFCIQHMVVRIFLWSKGLAPFRLARFLEFARENFIMRRVGGGYIFVHRLLRDHFLSELGSESRISTRRAATDHL